MSIISKFGFSPQVAGVFVSALLMASCSTIASPVSDSTRADAQSADAALSPAEADAETHAECKAMHEDMKAKMAEGSMMSSEDEMAMSPEMKAKHQKCMEMHEAMKASCKKMKDSAAENADATDGDMKEKHKHCKMMEDQAATGAGA